MVWDIRSDSREPVGFGDSSGRSSLQVAISDESRDASWRLLVEVFADGWQVLGAVDTVPRSSIPTGDRPQRVVAVASVPGARDWRITPYLIRGTRPTGASAVRARLSLSSVDDLTGGCCPLANVAGLSTLATGLPSTSPLTTGGVDVPTVGTAPVPLSPVPTYFRGGIVVQASPTNASGSIVWIVDSAAVVVTPLGLGLLPGQFSPLLPVSDASAIFVVGSVHTLKAVFVGAR